MKFRVTLTYECDVTADGAENYDTSDPLEMAEIDRQAFQDDPSTLVADVHDLPYVVNVEPV